MGRLNGNAAAGVTRISAKKVRSNRQNAARSTGPKTREGKEKSSRNAVKHGVFCSPTVLKGEDQAAFGRLREGLIAEHRPRTPTELFLVDRMALAMWRIDRVNQAEQASHENHHDYMRSCVDFDESRLPSPAGMMARMLNHEPGRSSVLEKLQQYEQRLERTVHRCLNDLRKLRTPIKGEMTPEGPSPYESTLETDVSEPESEETRAEAAATVTEIGLQSSTRQILMLSHQNRQIEPTNTPIERQEMRETVSKPGIEQ
jgi:hypothetical protein